jgi:hypothetical protein
MKKIIVAVVLASGIGVVAFASLGSTNKKAKTEKKMEKKEKKKECRRTCLFS